LFDTHIRKIHRLLFHVLAHIYHSHFKEIVLLQLHAHLNAVFVHFIEFNLRFHTVEEKELEVINFTHRMLRYAARFHEKNSIFFFIYIYFLILKIWKVFGIFLAIYLPQPI
jgi:hypothetical protein